MQIRRKQEEFEIKYLRKYHDLYVQSDILLLADVFENLRNMVLMVEKRIRRVIYQATHQNAKANNKYMKCYHKKKESIILP